MPRSIEDVRKFVAKCPDNPVSIAWTAHGITDDNILDLKIMLKDMLDKKVIDHTEWVFVYDRVFGHPVNYQIDAVEEESRDILYRILTADYDQVASVITELEEAIEDWKQVFKEALECEWVEEPETDERYIETFATVARALTRIGVGIEAAHSMLDDGG